MNPAGLTSLETEHGMPRGAIQRLEAPQFFVCCFFFFDVSEVTLSKCPLANTGRVLGVNGTLGLKLTSVITYIRNLEKQY